MLKRWWPVFLLFCVEIGLAFSNIKTGTWLIGWDSTQPELNFSLNLARGFSAAWQEYRGLGVTDGMAHSANLVHLVYTWIISNVVGILYVRYTFTLLAHFLGGVGMYALLRYAGRSLQGERVNRWVALAGTLFYLLNPYTLQMFYQPLELFVTHFAALPWLTFTLIQYISRPNKQNLLWFVLANILSLPQAHVPTLFIVWVMLTACLLLPALIWRIKRYGKQIIMVIAVSVGVHGFWGFPYIYSAVNNAKGIGEAKINVLSNPEVILRNESYGDIKSIVKMQGFSLEFEDWNNDFKYGLQMPAWVSWWDQEWVLWVMGGLMVMVGIGIGVSVIRRKWWMGGIAFMYVVAVGHLGSRIPYVREIGLYLRENVPYYETIFRFTFTKFAIVYALLFSILLTIGLLGLSKIFRGWGSKVLAIGVIAVVLTVAWPMWRGQFFYRNLKLTVPSEYQQVFQFFNENNDGRVLPLPYADFWGWQSNVWGYRGSGFMWQGIANPTLYGAFNAWSPSNETFYNQLSTAMYGGRSEDIARVLKQYDVRYVLLDESVIAPGQDQTILRIDQTKLVAQTLGWQEKFREGFLTVWEVPGEYGEQFVSAPSSYTRVVADTVKTRKDVVYEEVGTYVSEDSENSDNSENQIIYPFAGLMREEVRNLEYGEDGLQIKANGLQLEHELVIPGWNVGEVVQITFQNGEAQPAYYVNGQAGPVFLGKEKPEEGKNYLYAKVGEGEEWEEYLRNAELKNQNSEIKIEVTGEPFEYDFATQGQGTIGNCDVLKRGMVVKKGNIYQADRRGSVCDYVVITELFPRLSYLMRIQGENVEGRSLKYFLWNDGAKRNDLEYLLDKGKFDQTFALLPWGWDGYYTLNIEVRSFGEPTENRVEPIEVRWLPLAQIARAKIADRRQMSDLSIVNDLKISEVSKSGTWLYRVGVSGEGLLRLSQGYDEGWVGVRYQMPDDRFQLLDHVKVDGWANGWMVPESGEYVIFYWPQLLEYFGLVVLVGTGLGLLWPRRGRISA